MFDMSWGELMVIGGVALVVIGPKDLPKALRTVGQMTTKIRRMAGEFQSQFNEAMREAELDDLKKEIDGINTSVAAATNTGFNPIQTIRDELKGAVEGSAAAPLATSSLPTESTVTPVVPTEVPSVDLPVLPMPPLEPLLPEPSPAHPPALEPPAPAPADHPSEPAKANPA